MKKITYYTYLTLLIIIFIMLISFVIYYINNHDYYYQLYLKKANNIISYGEAPRGKIYDINGNLLVDNEEVLNIAYNQLKGLKKIDVATMLSKYTNFTKPSTEVLKEYYMVVNSREVNELITSKELDLLKKRELTSEDIYNKKYQRITDEMLNRFSDEDYQKATIYHLMNQGYSKEFKIILKDVTKEYYDEVINAKIPGIVGVITYKRKFLYDSTINQLIGNIGKISPKKEVDYLKKGYSLNDVVGTSYLEEYYEEYLHGEKAVYEMQADYALALVTPAKKGQDIYLNIDINLQLDIENILKKQIVELKKLKNTEYYNHSYIIISEPLTGKIKALTGIRLLTDTLDNYQYSNITSDIINTSFVMGSAIKGASITYAYQNELVEIDKKINDGCVKIYNIPAKCSFKKLGKLDEISALKWSSNYYQFLLAIKATGSKYHKNMKLNVTKELFNSYRATFSEYGLGTYTGIDLLNEFIGIKGKNVASDLLLNYVIGQYDTYTPLQLSQYINTIASGGKRNALQLMNKVMNDNKITILNEPNLLNEVNIKKEDMNRIQEGFKEVLDGGTGRGYIKMTYLPAGKTGTSESFKDTDGDYINDTKTITETSAMYAPYDNPKYSIVIISPDSGHYDGKTDYLAPINSRISKEVSKILFENY